MSSDFEARRRNYAPARAAVTWMLGTYGAFLLFGDTSGLDNLDVTTAFIALATLLWAVGYHWGIRSFPHDKQTHISRTAVPTAKRSYVRENRQVTISGIYFVLYSLSLLKAYGATPSTFWIAATHPGSAYQAKFKVIEDLTVTHGQTLLHALVFLSYWQLPLAPMMVFYWPRLRATTRTWAVLGLTSYVAFYLYIGTMQGLGFLLVGAIAGALARRHAPEAVTRRVGKVRKRRAMAVVAAGLILFALYMINAQSQRLDTFNVQTYQPNPTLEAIAGRSFARGAAVLAHYPTHGYRGLALNLETPFEWTEGRGSSRAIDTYWSQYLGRSVLADTYPARTQQRTGWPALSSWGTVYPWLASDFSFEGTLLLMVFLGRWTARMWLRSVYHQDPLSLMLFSQFALFVVFIPANNQVLISAASLFAVLGATGLYFGREIHHHFARIRTNGLHGAHSVSLHARSANPTQESTQLYAPSLDSSR